MTRRRKIRRNRHSFSRRRRFHIPWKVIGAVAALAVLCGLGALTAKWIGNGLSHKDPTPATSAVSEVSTPKPTAQNPTAATSPRAPQSPALEHARGFYLPASALLKKAEREAQVKSYAAAGYTAVLFDLKDTSGTLLYTSATQGAKKVKCAAKTALSVAELKDFSAFCEKEGVRAVPRLCCFEDPLAAKALDDARVLYAGDASFIWLDNSPSKGGKPWLNPYAPEAHAYLQGYVTELSALGFSDIMLTGVQFPNQTYAASFGSTKLSSLSKLDVLAKFVTDTKAAAKKSNPNARIIVCVPALATFSDNTTVYGGNPLNFGADAVAPLIFPDSLGYKLTVGKETLDRPTSNPGKAVELALKQIALRVKLIDNAKQPLLWPFVQAYDLTESAIKSEIKAVKTQNGAEAGFVLYAPNGRYPNTLDE